MKKLLILSVLSFVFIVAKAQVTGSIESNSILYVKDKNKNITTPNDKFGSNNYIRLDYSKDNITAGVQYESYLPALQGYSRDLKDSKITHRYLKYIGKAFEFTVGNFYEQFGSKSTLDQYTNIYFRKYLVNIMLIT